MVRVVVENPYPGGGSDHLETAAHSLETGQPVQHAFGGGADLDGGQHRTQRVERHVPARHRQPHHPRMDFAVELDVCDRLGALLFPRQQRPGQLVVRAVVRRAVPQHPDPQRRSAIGQRGRARVISADDERTAGGDALREGVEDRDVGIWTAEEIEMVGLDVGDHCDIRGVFQQRAVAFVGLGDEAVAAAVVSVGAGLAQLTADGEGRVPAAMLQGHDQHRRRGRLAVCAGHHQCGPAGHQLGQDRRPQHHRDAATTGLDEFGVGLRDRGVRGDDRRRAARQQIQRRGVVADPDQRATRPQRTDTA